MSATTRAILDCMHCAPDSNEYCDNHDVPRLASRLDTVLAALADLDSLRSERDAAVAERDEAEQHSLSEYARGVADGSEINVSILAESNVTLEEQRDLINSLCSERDAAVAERDEAAYRRGEAEDNERTTRAERNEAVAALADVVERIATWLEERADLLRPESPHNAAGVLNASRAIRAGHWKVNLA